MLIVDILCNVSAHPWPQLEKNQNYLRVNLRSIVVVVLWRCICLCDTGISNGAMVGNKQKSYWQYLVMIPIVKSLLPVNDLTCVWLLACTYSHNWQLPCFWCSALIRPQRLSLRKITWTIKDQVNRMNIRVLRKEQISGYILRFEKMTNMGDNKLLISNDVYCIHSDVDFQPFFTTVLN